MAFSNSPYYSTRTTEILPAVNNLSYLNSNSGFTQGLINMIPENPDSENAKDSLFATTRPAINSISNVATGANTTCRGMYIWEKSVGIVYYFLVVDSDATGTSYVASSTDGITFAIVNNLPTRGTGVVRFSEFIDSTNVKKLVLVDGVSGYVFTSNAAGTQIVSANFPTPHVPWPVFMDGRLYLAKANTGDLYNSDLNDPALWTVGNFISTEMYPDDIQAVLKVNNYILAVGTQSGEYFYDAGNAPGTPLAKYEGATLPFGTQFPNAIATDKGSIMMLTNSLTGGVTFRVIEGFSHKVIEAVGAIAQNVFSLDPAGCRANFFRRRGDLFYSLTVSGANVGTTPSQYSYIYSVRHKIWSAASLTTWNGALSTIIQWPAYYMQSGSTVDTTSTYVAGHYNNIVYLGKLDYTAGADVIGGGVLNQYIVQQAIFPPTNFGTNNAKTMSRVYVDYSRPLEDLAGLQKVIVGWNDFLTGAIQQNFANLQGWATPSNLFTGLPSPAVTQLGYFRRRQMQVVIIGGLSRLYSISVDINKGSR